MNIGRFTSLLCGMFILISCRQGIAHPGDMNDITAGTQASSPPQKADTQSGRALFLRNCAHCHGADARGDEGPDLHKLDLSDEWIANRIRKGKAGQMTSFAGRLQPSEIDALVRYVQTLK